MERQGAGGGQLILAQVRNGDRNFDWKDLAACAGMAQPRRPDGKAIDYFYDTYEDEPETRDSTKRICRACPVRENCLIEGISGGETGVWGGEYLENGSIQPNE